MNSSKSGLQTLPPELEQLLTAMDQICDDLAWGRYDRAGELFELTKRTDYPAPVAKLAESFGMMLVKVEAREYRLEEMIAELRRVGDELREAQRRLVRENQGLKKGLAERYSAKRIISSSPVMRAVLEQAERIADTSITVLITGETGTGKELLAKALHYNSPRKAGPFIGLNCSAVPETLFERELFGIEKGVATGVSMHRGLLEQAHGGTLLLDEIADMPLSCQGKLLRVLEERELTRVGGSRTVPFDVRILAATNKNLSLAVQCNAFREDLFFRLNVITLRLPPLRERVEDIAPLARHFLALHARSMNRDEPRMGRDAQHVLQCYAWPGNVRELSNEMERLVALSCTGEIHPEDLSGHIRDSGCPAAGRGVAATAVLPEMPPCGSVRSASWPHAQACIPSGPASGHASGPNTSAPASATTLAETGKLLIENALRATGGNKAMAARLLGLSREGLRKKLMRLAEME